MIRQGSNRAQESKSTPPETKYECPDCKDLEGWIERREDGTEYWVDCACKARREIRRLFKFSEISDVMQQKSLDKLKMKGRPSTVVEAYETCVDYVELLHEVKLRTKKTDTRSNQSLEIVKQLSSVFLGGEPGSGKTSMLMSIANEFIKEEIPVLYFPFVEALEDLKGDIKAQGDEYLRKLHRIQQVPVLFIDDLFKSKASRDGERIIRVEPTPYEIKFLHSVLNYRYLNNLPILVSSELTIEQVIYWDSGVGSRIFQMCGETGGNIVHLVGQPDLNYRLPPDFQAAKPF